MLGKMGAWRHAVVASSIVGVAVLAATGIIGRGLPERFESKVVTVTPSGADGVRIREVVDEDFGAKSRHGYERIIPTDFGNPIDIEASSPDANTDIDVTPVATGDRIRLGNVNTSYTGQHRYVLAYTLPDARLSTGQLALDIIGTDEELETGRFEVVVAGLDLADPTCNVGNAGDVGGCTLARDGDVYRAVITPLDRGQGITIGGTITGRTDPAESIDPPLPPKRPDNRLALALATIPLGLFAAAGVYVATRRAGRNEVFAGGAADAAYGVRPASDAPPLKVRLVADSKMDELATIEFVPPKGVEPWQGAVLVDERIDRTTVAAWVSGLVAREALTLTEEDGDLVVRRGPHHDQLDAEAKTLVSQMLDYGDELKLGTYNANFGKAWNQIFTVEREAIAASGWWKRLPPGDAKGGAGVSAWVIVAIIALVFFGAGSLIVALLGAFRGTIAALLFAVFVPAVVAFFAYRVMLSVRSATGSALALRTESFRRFLSASEGQHVDWAWQQGLLREYSAWAVALGAADAWGRALAHSNVPAPERNLASPMLLYSMGPSFDSTRSAPTSSGGVAHSAGDSPEAASAVVAVAEAPARGEALADRSAGEGGARRNGCTACPCHVEVGHQRELGNIDLLVTQAGVCSHRCQVPVAELRIGLDDAATDEIGIGVGEVGGDGEQTTYRDRLLFEDLAGHFVTAFAEPAQQLGCLVDGRADQFVFRVLGEPVGQQVLADACQRRHALDVSDETAIAPRYRLPVTEQTVHRDVYVTEFAGHTGGTSDNVARFDHATTESGADDRRYRGAPQGQLAEVDVVGVQRRGVAVVAVHHGDAETEFEGLADIESPPFRKGEVRRTPRRDHTFGRCRSGRVEAHDADVGGINARDVETRVEGLRQRIERGLGSLHHPARYFYHPIDQELTAGVEHGDVVLRSAVVDADDHGPWVAHVPPFRRDDRHDGFTRCTPVTHRSARAR